MKIFPDKPTPLQWQILVWVVIFIINFFSFLSMDGLMEGLIFTCTNTLTYAIIIYGNINFLFPRLYEKNRVGWYIVCTVLFLAVVGIGRTYLTRGLYNHFFAEKPELITVRDILYYTVAGVVVYILSLVFRIALAYFKLKQQAEQMLEQKSVAELNLLKSQVQPHFLFNTLNNIYYEAYRESPRTALLIGRLSEIMRYFVDESPKEKVALTTEIQFLENYIALEKIRIRHGVKVFFAKECEGEYKIPPMLLMTFVENIFKHGIDRSGNDNKIMLSLQEENGYLLFRTENAIPDAPVTSAKEGFGIKNLQKRLTLLYGNNFELHISGSGQFFNASLKIPLL
jgi:sensor histidine kinase YesM